VQERLAEHFKTDPVVSDTIVADAEGDYLCHRYYLLPYRQLVWIRFPVLTCALLQPRRVVHESGTGLESRWRDLGDTIGVMDRPKRGGERSLLRRFTSDFALSRRPGLTPAPRFRFRN
jgi:hypothetical protein